MDRLGICGIITLHRIPDEWTDEEFRYWYCPVTAPDGSILQEARLSDAVKRRWQIPLDDGRMQAENILTNTGIRLLLANMSVAGQGSMNPFFQILSVGNMAIAGVTRADTAVAGDGFATGARKAPASFSTTGFSTTVVTNYASTDAIGSWTNIGVYGYKTASSQAATTTAGTGALMTHAQFSYSKGSSAIAVNYVFVLSN
jgi:hypothetical protein